MRNNEWREDDYYGAISLLVGTEWPDDFCQQFAGSIFGVAVSDGVLSPDTMLFRVDTVDRPDDALALQTANGLAGIECLALALRVGPRGLCLACYAAILVGRFDNRADSKGFVQVWLLSSGWVSRCGG